MFGAFQIARAYGIPVQLHWTMFLFMPYLASEMSQGMGMSVGWGWAAVLLLFLSVALHEFGHALVARGRGYPVRNIVLTPIGGVAYLQRAPGRPRDEMVIAIAGPLVSVALALACGAGLWLAVVAGAEQLSLLLLILAGLNTSLFMFNLIPCFPMDGGRMFRAWQSGRVGRLEATRRAVKLGKILAVLMGLWGLSTSHWTLVIIAFVVYQAAATEYRQVQMQEMARRMPPNPFGGFGPFSVPPPFARPPDRAPTGEVIEVEVSPPPYRK